MATAAKGGRTLSKTRKALVIIESAALTSAVVLLGWLALWLIHQRAGSLRVEAFYSHDDRAPFQESDALTLVGAQRRPVDVPRPDALPAAVLEVCRRPGAPVVVSVSSPALGPSASPDAALIALIKGVVEEAECDVVLAVDRAQVDSDRELDVYANAPYNGLAERVRELKPGGHVVYVMTSAAPAQKSWGSEGFGRSVFAYFLQKGLAGDARGWDREDVSGRISVEGLHRYVHDHVARWARDHRGSVQTPMLLRVGDPRRPVTLAFARPPAPAAPDSQVVAPPAVAKKEEATKQEADASAAKPPRPVEPREALFVQLLAEWKAHDALLARVPYRSHPATFRTYQDELLKAERRLRESWAGGASLAVARDALDDATRSREQLLRTLDTATQSGGATPFRPARSEEEGRLAVTDALMFLTGVGPEEGLSAVRPPVAAAKSEKKDGDKAVAPPAPPRGPSEPPEALALTTVRGIPERYLELQLPAWALGFIQEFRIPDYFRFEPRRTMLRRLVEARARAEDALALDPRGLDWVRPAIKKEDEPRRRLQDQLFSPGDTAGEAGRAAVDGVLPIRDAYEKALRFMRTYQQGRATWELVAAELPDLVEYAVRAEERRLDAVALADHPLPPDAHHALEDAESLIKALDRPVPPDDARAEEVQERQAAIEEAARKARASIELLEKAVVRDPGRDWPKLDAALSTPWIPADVRRTRLRTVLDLGASERVDVRPDKAASAADATSADPNFWRLAGGLAKLDERLREIAAGASGSDADGDSVAQGWDHAKGAPASADSAALEAFATYSARARELRARARDERARRGRGEPRKAEDLHAAFQAADRSVRLLGRGDFKADGREEDEAVADWDRLATSRLLAFQADRLHKDYVVSAPDLVREAARLAREVGAEEPRDPFVRSSSLTLQTDPPARSPLRIDAEGKAELQIGLARSENGDESDRLPPGRAFVGVAAPPAGLSVTSESIGPPFGSLVAVPFAGGPRTRLVVRQVDASATSAFELTASAFYRGRVDQGATIPVAVVPLKSPDPEVRIAYDKEALKRIYGEFEPSYVDRIKDQFQVHRNEGYMHRGKSATYRLHFSNPTFQEIVVAYKRTLVSPGGGEPLPVDVAERALRIPPGRSDSIPGEVTSDQTPLDKPRDLVVEWRIGDKKAMPPLRVPFRQVEASRYMKFTPSIGFPETDRGRGECFIVVGRRDKDDFVCEPILGREVSVTIEGVTTRLQSNYRIERGEAFESMSDRTPGKTGFKWSAVVENQQFPTEEFNAR